MIVAKSRDVQEVVSKLSSDKAKTREVRFLRIFSSFFVFLRFVHELFLQEGIKLLSTWLEGEGSFSFCKLIGRKTAMLNPGDIPHCCFSLSLSNSMTFLLRFLWNIKHTDVQFFFVITMFLLVSAAETWPFLVKLLITCIKLEISTSKKRPPKLLLAKMLRTIVQHAEDIRFSGITV